MAKNENTIYWIIAGILLVILLSQTPLKFPFAIVTTTVCFDNTTSYFNLDADVLDSRGINNGILPIMDYQPSFVAGKIGNAIEFNTTTYVNFTSIPGNTVVMWVKDNTELTPTWKLIADVDGINYVNGVADNSVMLMPLGLDTGFGIGFNGSVDEIAVFDESFTTSKLLDLYTNPQSICYVTSVEEEITCKDFATEQLTEQTTGCLNYSGDFFPNCTYSWETTSGYYVSGTSCLKRLYCEDILTSDYSTLTLCDESLNATTTTTTGTPSIGTTTTPEETIMDKLDKEVFKLGDTSVTLLHLLIALAVLLVILYSGGYIGK